MAPSCRDHGKALDQLRDALLPISPLSSMTRLTDWQDLAIANNLQDVSVLLGLL